MEATMNRTLQMVESVGSFSDYFKLNIDIEVVLAWFDVSFLRQDYMLPRQPVDATVVAGLYERLQKSLPYINLTSEMARREFLIAPVVLELIQLTHAKVKVEYPLEVSERLRGTLDYFVQTEHKLLIIEAKNADMQRGFTQLAVELIALDQWLDDDSTLLYGAVSVGDVWQFGILDRTAKRVIQDINIFRVPADLQDLLSILVAILSDERDPTS